MLDYTQLEALLAVEETGTFEGAARKLNLSSFAVIQRIKALEVKMGTTLIQRKPTRTSEAGQILCEHARKVRNLANETIEAHRLDTLELSRGSAVFRIAVDDEELSGWFIETLSRLGSAKQNQRLDVVLATHQQAADQMRSGAVVAALSSHRETVYGFKTYSLGSIEYCAVASPSFVNEYFSMGVTKEALSNAPALRFCGRDELIHDWMKKAHGKMVKIPMFRHPSNMGVLGSCLNGNSWSMQPKLAIKEELEAGSLVELIGDLTVTRKIYWHVAGNLVDEMRSITNDLRSSYSEPKIMN